MLPLRLKLYWTVSGLAALLLAACGGGGTDGPSPGTNSPPPVAATAELSVQIRGTGSITSQPVGINCSNASCTGVFASGAVVTLTATPGSGQAFAGWGGACAGSTSTCSVTMDQVRAASAEFVAAAGNSGASYEALAITASRADFARQLNAQGAKGFNYFGPNVLGGSAFNLYSKDSANTFTAEILDTPATAAAFVAQLNAQGANGFDFWGPETTGSVYTKESGAAALTYEVLAAPTTAAGFLSQANAQGDKGFLYVGPYTFGNIYRKSAAGNTKYVYRLELQTASHDGLLTQANVLGQQGYKFGGLLVFSGESVGAFRNVYVRDSAQAASFEWKNRDSATTAAGLIAQANAEGTSSYVYWFSVILESRIKDLYFKPTACAGPLCRSTSPL